MGKLREYGFGLRQGEEGMQQYSWKFITVANPENGLGLYIARS